LGVVVVVVCNLHFSYPLSVCSYCQSFDQDMNSCLYYDVSNESHVRLNAMIEAITEQHTHFVSEMREFGLLNETYHSLPSSRINASLFDDCEST